jgi:nicotinamide riboside kinase
MTSIVVAILGAECTGKTTLAAALAAQLREDTGLRVGRVDEHLRAWCDREGRTPRRDEQPAIAHAQTDAIDDAARRHDIVIADTTALMTAVYSRFVFDDTSLNAQAVAAHRRVDVTLVTAVDLPWQPDGIQRDGAHVREPVLRTLRGLLLEHGLAFSMVSGSGDRRLQAAMDAVAARLRGLPTPRTGLFTRLAQRNASAEARAWRCERCDDPDCEHALRVAR